jgi:hypothetical protein
MQASRGGQGVARKIESQGWEQVKGLTGLNVAKVSYGARAAWASGFALHREV